MAQPGLALSMLEELCLCDAVYAPPDDLVPAAPEAGFDWASGAAVTRAAARMLASRSLRSKQPDLLTPSAAVIGMDTVSNRGAGEALPSSRTGSVDTTSCDDQSLDERQRREGKVTQPAEERNIGQSNKEEKMNGKKENEAGGGSRRSGRPETLVRELFLCAALLPLAGVKHTVKKGKLEAAAQSVVLESLKVRRPLSVVSEDFARAQQISMTSLFCDGVNCPWPREVGNTPIRMNNSRSRMPADRWLSPRPRLFIT